MEEQLIDQRMKATKLAFLLGFELDLLSQAYFGLLISKLSQEGVIDKPLKYGKTKEYLVTTKLIEVVKTMLKNPVSHNSLFEGYEECQKMKTL